MSEDRYFGRANVNVARVELAIVICFGVVSGVLLAAGALCLWEGLNSTLSWSFIIFGFGLVIATVALAQEWGFIEGQGTLGPTYSGP